MGTTLAFFIYKTLSHGANYIYNDMFYISSCIVLYLRNGKQYIVRELVHNKCKKWMERIAGLMLYGRILSDLFSITWEWRHININASKFISNTTASETAYSHIVLTQWTYYSLALSHPCTDTLSPHPPTPNPNLKSHNSVNLLHNIGHLNNYTHLV